MINTLGKALCAAALLAIPSLALAAPASLTVKKSDSLGEYIADGEGKSLYLFKADTQAKDGKEATSACYDKCAGAWPPFVASDKPAAGDGVNASLIGAIERRDGSMQVTYNGWPLYYFVKDQKPGDTTGQDIEGFGEEWYLLTPSGDTVHGKH
jgi:predicted lipoprotein with Yx(FWY)xxD motif